MTERKGYAAGTKTSIEASESQIKKMLQREGATRIAILEEPDRAIVAFELKERSIRFNLPLPSRKDQRFTMARVNQHRAMVHRSEGAAADLWVQACRERWRQLHLCIKAKLESIAQNIETFDEAFLAHVVMPDGYTVGEHTIKEMQAQLEGKPMRPLLMPPGERP